MSTRTLPLLVLTLVILAGTYFRVADLGRKDYGVDELYQVYAARSLQAGAGPRLPSGRIYRRGIDVTHMVRLSVEQFGPKRWAVRLPSAFFGVASLVVFAAVMWAIAGPWAAVWATALLAVYPEAIEQSRALRFYTYQLLWGIIALYTGWRALRTAGSQAQPNRIRILKQWAWAALTLAALAMAVRVQVAAFSVAAGWGVCVLVAAAADVAARGASAWRTSVPLQLAAAGALGLLLLLVAVPNELFRIIESSQYLPAWALAAGTGSPLTYYYALSEAYPVLVGFLPVVLLLSIVRQPRVGLYLTLWFAVPLLLHSLVFPWRASRYVLLAMPALFGAAGIVAAWGAGALRQWLGEVLGRAGISASLRGPLTAAFTALASVTLLITMPAVSRARAQVARPPSQNWSAAASIVQSRADLEGVPVGHAWPLHALAYFGRLDFIVKKSSLPALDDPQSAGEWQSVLAPAGSLDDEVGRPVLPTEEAIRERFGDAGSVLIGFDTSYVSVNNVDQELFRVLSAQAEELCRGRCGKMHLYHWPLGTERQTQQHRAPSNDPASAAGGQPGSTGAAHE